MNAFFTWLGNKLFPNKQATRSAPKPEIPRVRVRPRPVPTVDMENQEIVLKNTDSFKTSTGGHIEDRGPGKNVLIRNKYIREDTGTHETLKIVDELLDEDKATGEGIDPYNTGRFDRSKTWDKRSRK